MNTYDSKARMEELRREHEKLAEEILPLSKAEIRTIAFLFGIGALFALVCISIGVLMVRLL